MTTESLHKSIMPWEGVPATERLLNVLVAIGLLLVLLLYFIIPRIELPEEEIEEIPERFAQLIIEEEPEEIPPPEVPEEEPVEEEVPEEEPEEIEEPEPEPEPEEVVVEKPEQTVEEAREVAQQSGLMAFQDSLAAMRDSLSIDTSAPLLTASNAQRKEYSGSDLNTDLTQGSGGVDTAALTSNTGTSGSLGGRKTGSVSGSKIKASGTGTATSTKGTAKSARSSQQIALALQSLRGTLDRILNKARRKDPSLGGIVTFRVKLDASGKVLEVTVVKSLLNSPSVEKQMADRIKLLGNFGAGIAETIEFPVEFAQ